MYLTNTLEEAERKAETLFGPLRVISEEANAASEIKRDLPILAVIGNPPYSGHSANRSWEIKNGKKVLTFIGRLIQDYYKVDGKPLGEKNPKWLQDDYVKFIRWGQWRIERTGSGVLAFITNHGYLDNPTFRGMRQQLMRAFSEIYVLNLHGNSKKKEKCPGGSPDENVFDIQQGVTLGIFVKTHRGTGVSPVSGHGQDAHATSGPVENHGQDAHATARVFHADLWGLREAKYDYLFENSVEKTAWKELCPRSPGYLFIPQEQSLSAEYSKGWKITDAMPVNVLGFQTHRDHFAIDLDASALRERIDDLREATKSDQELRSLYGLQDGGGWKLSAAREQVRRDKKWTEHFIECLYRPFDRRSCYFSTVAMDRPRAELLDHVAGKNNLCLNTVRQTKLGSWQHAVVSDAPAPAVYVELKDGSNLFPLYLYPCSERGETGQRELGFHAAPWSSGENGRVPNLNPEFIANMEKRLGLKFVPDGGGGTGVPPVENHGHDAHATLRIRHGAYLPHWTSDGAIYAVCFRLGDSLPESAIDAWTFERENVTKTARQMRRPLSAQEEHRLEELFSDRVEKILDEGRGACWMQEPDVAALVAGAQLLRLQALPACRLVRHAKSRSRHRAAPCGE